MSKWQPYALLYIGWPRGRMVTPKPQSTLGIFLSKREYAIWECHVELHGGAPPLVGHIGGGPPMRCHALLPLLEGLFGLSKKMLFQKSKICFHYSRRHFSASE